MSESLDCDSCTTGVCGTGGWDGPKPGDPNMDDITLNAVPIAGGVEVSWSYPTSNPGAVSFTRVFRNTSNDFEGAFQRVIVGGNTFRDVIVDTSRTYFYWIQMTSIYGTEGAVIGPDWAKPLGRLTAEDLDGSIGLDHLDPWLSQEIEKIAKTYDELSQEIRDRVQYTDALADALAAMGEDFEGTIAVIDNRVNSHQDGMMSLMERQDTFALANANALAAIMNIQEVMVTEDSAWAENVSQVLSEYGDDLALVKTTQTTLSNAQESLATQVNSVSAVANKAAADILVETNARATADAATASQLTSLNVALNNNAAAIQQEQTARINATNALSQTINTNQVTLNGQISSVQQTSQASINTLTGKVDAIWGAKIDANGRIGGFTISSQPNGGIGAHFDVDSFRLGRANTSGYPFQLKSIAGVPTIVIQNAMIENLSLGNDKIGLKAVTDLQYNIAAGRDINHNGDAFNQVTINMPSNSSGVMITGSFPMSAIPVSTGESGYVTADVWVTKHPGNTTVGGTAGVKRLTVNERGQDVSILAVDTSPVVGNNTYYLSARYEGSSGTVTSSVRFGVSTMVVQGAKR